MTEPTPAAMRAAKSLTAVSTGETPTFASDFTIRLLAQSIDDATGLPELLAVLRDAREELRLIRMKDGAVYDPTLTTRIDVVLARHESNPAESSEQP